MGANGINPFDWICICRACDRATGQRRDTAPDRKSHRCMVVRTSLRNWPGCPFSVPATPLVPIFHCKKINSKSVHSTHESIRHSTYADFPTTLRQCSRISSLDLPSMSMSSSLPFSDRKEYRWWASEGEPLWNESLTVKASNEWRWCQILQGNYLHARVFVLDLRWVPEGEISGPSMMVAVQIVMYAEHFDLVLQHQFTVIQIVQGSPDRRSSFHERHSVNFCAPVSLPRELNTDEWTQNQKL